MINLFHDRRMAAGIVAFTAFLPLASSAWAQGQTAPPVIGSPQVPPVAPVAPKAPPEPADVAAQKVSRDGTMDAYFVRMHESFLKRGKEGKIGLLFLGDSITQGWGNAKDVWADHYAKYDVANFGIGGDRTEHVLWRIDNGELDGISPKVVVLMMGTNNIGYKADDIIAGDKKIVAEIHQKLPDTKVLLLGIFPRGDDPSKPNVARMRDKIKTVNAALATLDDGNKTRYLDIGDKFLTPTGIMADGVMKPDALHPVRAGYVIWADAMQPLLDEMMK